MKRRSQSLKTLAPNVEDFDEVPDLGSLRFEDYDLGNVNEHQRQLRNLVDYEKLNYKPMKVDSKKLEEALQKDSVKEEELKRMVAQGRQDQEEQKELPEAQAVEEDFFEVVADNDEDEEDTHEDAILGEKEAITMSNQRTAQSHNLVEGQNEEQIQS